MSKTSTQSTQKPVRFYKKAAFPWTLIALAVVIGATFIVGFHAGQANEQHMQNRADQIVSQLKAGQTK